jgi:aromatic ring hydroxylase
LLKSEFRRETDALVFDFISICWDRIMWFQKWKWNMKRNDWSKRLFKRSW